MFADILKQLRAESNISQGKLAKSIGVSGGNVSSWEGGESKPGYTALCALAQFFGVSADYLLELSPQKGGEKDDGLHRLDEFKQEQGLACDGSPLSGEETDLIAMYRLLPCYVREDIFELIFFHYKKHVEKKKESIYWTYAADREEKSDPGEDESTSGIA